MFVKSLSLALASLFSLPRVMAAEPPASIAHKAILTLAIAQQIPAQARKVASEHGWPSTLAAVAVVQP